MYYYYRQPKFYPTEICVEHNGIHGIGPWLCSTILLEFGDHRNGRTKAPYGLSGCKFGHRVSRRKVIRQYDSLQKGMFFITKYFVDTLAKTIRTNRNNIIMSD